MINNIILHDKLSCVYEKLQHCKGVKIQKKIKKIGRGWMFTDALAWGGGGVYLQRIATLVWFVVGGFGKGDTRQRQTW